MPRNPRIFFPSQPVHLVKRGHNRNPIVFQKADYHYFVQSLARASHEHSVALHAWVLMTNHFHLLASPSTENSIPVLMQWLSGCYSRYFNIKYHRAGTLWDGRYHASLILTEGYLLECYRYIELNPVRAGMVTRPGDYPWSSYRENAHGGAAVTETDILRQTEAGRPMTDGSEALQPDSNEKNQGNQNHYCSRYLVKGKMVTPHSLYMDLSDDPERRCIEYRQFVDSKINQKAFDDITRGIDNDDAV